MSMEEKEQTFGESLHDPELPYQAFGIRMRQIRKERGLTLDEFAELLGTSKQVLSRYEMGQCDTKISQVTKFAKILNMSVDYLLGDDGAEVDKKIFWKKEKRQPFYKIFIEVTADKMGLDIPGVAKKTGLTEWEVRSIITRQIKAAPLELAMQLSETLDVPLETWIDIQYYRPTRVTDDSREVAEAYERASLKDKNMARMALNLDLIKEEAV